MFGKVIANFSPFRNDSGYKDNMSLVAPTMSPTMTFTRNSLTIVIAYCICFLIAAVGNLSVFLTLSRGRYRKSRISLMICHLSIADLLVAFFTIPIEVSPQIYCFCSFIFLHSFCVKDEKQTISRPLHSCLAKLRLEFIAYSRKRKAF